MEINEIEPESSSNNSELKLKIEDADDISCLPSNPHLDKLHGHQHYSHRAPWLRAALLGANDGLVSTSSLMLGIAGASTKKNYMLLAGVAGLTAGALSMACGEYVSVAGQKDAEQSDWIKEKNEFLKGPEFAEREKRELAECYVRKGLSKETATKVVEELHENSLDDIVKIHMRDELAVDVEAFANPIQASIISAITFSVGACLPILITLPFHEYKLIVVAICILSAIALLTFGVLGAILGGASSKKVLKSALRMFIGGALAMAGTFG
ncbi:hypothetical protein HK096_008691, partial [Nowakowskiella sp. JEL0078]